MEIRRSLVLEAKINCETKLERDMNSECIWDPFWDQKLSKFGSKMHLKTRLDTLSFLERFFGALEGAGVEVGYPKMTSKGGV